MAVSLRPHAYERAKERGATEDEVIVAVEKGECFQAKFGRTGFRHNFQFNNTWRGKHYRTKQVEAYAVKERNGDWSVVTVITHYF